MLRSEGKMVPPSKIVLAAKAATQVRVWVSHAGTLTKAQKLQPVSLEEVAASGPLGSEIFSCRAREEVQLFPSSFSSPENPQKKALKKKPELRTD